MTLWGQTILQSNWGEPTQGNIVPPPPGSSMAPTQGRPQAPPACECWPWSLAEAVVGSPCLHSLECQVLGLCCQKGAFCIPGAATWAQPEFWAGRQASVPSRHCLPSPRVLAETTRPHHQPPSALLSFPSGGLWRPAYASCSFPCPTHFLSICRTSVSLGTPSNCAALATRVLGLSPKPSPGPCLPSWARGQSWV